ncbi:MAG TPA: ABC-F family ATP-binding cassette domain-containing protein [Longilinea sp.]|nr:ABC-F family ATP-binding cassette domain-containing protein [Longilinea sp.]
MSLISAIDLGKSYGARDIFAHITLSVPRRGRAALVGANGVGKTTLLRILLGLEEPSAGRVERAKGLRVGYLPQDSTFETDNNLWDECLTAFADLVQRRRELERLEAEMSDPDKAEAALESYGRLQAEFEHLGGYTFELRIRQTLTGLGFAAEDEQRPLTQFSGGERTRALLARLLLSNPDLLLLDEPTNHLDIAAVEWLENYLADWEGAVLIVSHDRYFLDRVAKTIWEMTPALEMYHGNYSAYLMQREERYQRRLEEYEKQQEFVEKEEEYIRRNLAGQNTRQAQGRRTRLERLLKEARLTPPTQGRKLHMKLEAVGRSGDLVLRTYGLSVGYADEGKPLFAVPDLVLRRGECAAVIGPNGAGKTTFLKTILDQIPPLAGEVELGSSLKIGYFAQAHEGLHQKWMLMEEIQAQAPRMLPAEVRDYLAKFLFTGDDVFKPVSTLSGGERGRLALACLALQGANLLLLDEPTNHLDLPAQEVLQNLLANYAGTILLVSHDRYLIDALATQVWEVLPEEGTLRVFGGTYSEYKAARQTEAEKSKAAPKEGAKSSEQTVHPATKLSKDRQRRHRQRVDALEREITQTETEMATLAQQLEKAGLEPAEAQKLGKEYVRLQAVLEEKMTEWEQLSKE